MSEPVPYPVLNDDEPVKQFNELDASLTYSYSSYLNWLFPERVELIKGKIFKMSPAPSSFHQLISGKIYRRLGNFLEKHPCKVFISPFDVRFLKGSNDDKEIFTVLQPDICVICDSNKIDARGCIGAPDIVVEVLSPGNTKTELLHKYRVYEEFGVKEYWVVSQGDKSILIYTLDEMGKFQPSKIFTLSEKITSTVLLDFELALDDVFEDVD
ncbi:Endonuclease, Uma2 family (restriction endonuclease fold) [Pedobacter terrae]|uniref:Endonuclease, Uma2 family (Restriction endonuclease fold) n=1 Tax=Pedobacter terrae TaxID=405671 RepID=A0A1G7VL89_9SPHI|nr:Uma2 family endonuclease [Pedobacter terrae]SDG60338.1 Endonuclease, Uma2 family (restriction endonuclease fold) [Pedobacter terrae]